MSYTDELSGADFRAGILAITQAVLEDCEKLDLKPVHLAVSFDYFGWFDVHLQFGERSTTDVDRLADRYGLDPAPKRDHRKPRQNYTRDGRTALVGDAESRVTVYCGYPK